MREKATSAIINIARKSCAADISAIRTSNNRSAFSVAAIHRRGQKAPFADSESRLLAIKKFSCTTASRLIVARQIRFFAGIATADSQCGFSSASRVAAGGAWLMHAGARLTRPRADHAGVTAIRYSDAEFGLEQIVHDLRIGLAAG
jgi:hypothetical protein